MNSLIARANHRTHTAATVVGMVAEGIAVEEIMADHLKLADEEFVRPYAGSRADEPGVGVHMVGQQITAIHLTLTVNET